MSSIWKYFNPNGKDWATCLQCKKKLKTVGGSTSGMHYHMKTQHKINVLKRLKSPSDDTQSSQRNVISNYFKEEIDRSLEAVISRLVAKDNMPFHKFVKSKDLIRLFKGNGYDVPKSPSTIRRIVIEYGKKVRNDINNEIFQDLQSDGKYSLTFDEWTSIKNRRFLNINIHCINKYWNLGLVRIIGSMPSEKCTELIERKLKEFGLCFDNIVSITTDGSAVMKKVGRIINGHQQLCMAHGIQLGVIKVLYSKRHAVDDAEVNDVEVDDENDVDDSDDDFSDEYNNGFMLEYEGIFNPASFDNDMRHDIYLIIQKIRNVVRLFRRSPTKNDNLQKHVQQEFGKEIMLILDLKVRWNSLLSMLERFYLLKTCIRKSLIDLNVNYTFQDGDIIMINDIILALQPIKITVEAICSSDSTLLGADVALEFMLNELSTQKSKLAQVLKSELISRIQDRRTPFSGLLQYLHNPTEILKKSEKPKCCYDIFNPLNRKTIISLIVSLMERLQIRYDIEYGQTNNYDYKQFDSSGTTVESAEMTLQDKLKLAIRKKNEIISMEKTCIRNTKDLEKIVRKEMILFEAENRRSKYLSLAYNYLRTTKPTSVESERAFSSAGLICTKIRSRLNDDTLDVLCFLRAHFIAQDVKKI